MIRKSDRRVNETPRRAGRKDIQGLRAFAVLAVVLDHFLGWPTGGFVGVDIFFVISGYLITDLLLREYARTGHISFLQFYKRRAKRILPAAIPVLLLTIVASWFLFNRSRYIATLWDGVWSFLFVGNWRFATAGTDYFQQGGPTSPLQHFWSLAVEEQFYLIWPWLLLGVFAIFNRRGSTRRAIISASVTIGILTVSSFLWALRETALAPTVAYFSTGSRAWELGVGACLAVVAPVLSDLPNWLRPILAWTGLAGMIAALFWINDSSVFPAPAAAAPVLATALVIAAGTGAVQQRLLFPLINPVATYVGDISYSLYLWHFPIITMLGSAMVPSNLVVGTALAITFILAAFSYHLIENPIRHGQITVGPKRKGRRANVRLTLPNSYKYVALGLTAFITLGVVTAAVWPRSVQAVPTAVPYPAGPTQSTTNKPVAPHGPEVALLQKEMTAALAKTAWPKLSPTIDEILESDESLPNLSACAEEAAPNLSRCVWGSADAPKTAVVMGDSLSVNWVAPLAELYGTGDWNLQVLSRYGCPHTDFEKRFTDGQDVNCAQRKAAALDYVKANKPDVIFVANTSLLPASAETLSKASGSQWTVGLSSFLKKMPKSSQVVVLAAPPPDKDIRECYTRRSSPANCVSTLTLEWWAVHNAEVTAAKSAKARHIDTRALFCTDKGQCPSFIGAVPVKRDDTHMGFRYSKALVPALKELLSTSGVEH